MIGSVREFCERRIKSCEEDIASYVECESKAWVPEDVRDYEVARLNDKMANAKVVLKIENGVPITAC